MKISRTRTILVVSSIIVVVFILTTIARLVSSPETNKNRATQACMQLPEKVGFLTDAVFEITPGPSRRGIVSRYDYDGALHLAKYNRVFYGPTDVVCYGSQVLGNVSKATIHSPRELCEGPVEVYLAKAIDKMKQVQDGKVVEISPSPIHGPSLRYGGEQFNGVVVGSTSMILVCSESMDEPWLLLSKWEVETLDEYSRRKSAEEKAEKQIKSPFRGLTLKERQDREMRAAEDRILEKGYRKALRNNDWDLLQSTEALRRQLGR